MSNDDYASDNSPDSRFIYTNSF